MNLRLLAVALCAACIGVSVFAAGESEGGAVAATPAVASLGESPMLAERVSAGDLPPVAERLPENPFVQPVHDQIGRYGGTLRRVYTGRGDLPGFSKLSGAWLLTTSPDGSELVPDLAESFSAGHDGREYTFHLRRGVKWSDGDPWDADDIMWFYDHVVMNKELNPGVPSHWRVGSEPIALTKIDDYTVQFHLPGPSAVFLQNLTLDGRSQAGVPAHYLKAFHADFVDADELAAMVKEAQFDSWVQLFTQKNSEWLNPERPTLRAWKNANPIGDEVVVLERNPYFYKVDPEGNQLPYIDRIEARLVLDRANIPLSAMSGEIDFQLRHVAFSTFPLLMENRDRGGYDVLRWPYSLGSAYAFMPNLNVKDARKNELFNDRRFRVALSHAIDREELNEILFLGVTVPRHATVVPESEFYDPELEQMYASFDPELSRRMLEEIGLVKGADGYFDYPDGSDLAVTVTTIPLETYGKWADMAELVGGYWDELGIKNEVQVIERSLYTERYRAGDLEIAGWAWGRGLAPLIAPKFVFPSDNTFNPAPLWGRWYQTGGAEGAEPPADHPVRRAMEMYGEYTSEPDPAKRLQIGRELIRLSAEEIWSIGTVGVVPDPVVVSRRLGNVPENLLSEHLLSSPNNAGVIQFYFKE